MNNVQIRCATFFHIVCASGTIFGWAALEPILRTVYLNNLVRFNGNQEGFWLNFLLNFNFPIVLLAHFFSLKIFGILFSRKDGPRLCHAVGCMLLLAGALIMSCVAKLSSWKLNIPPYGLFSMLLLSLSMIGVGGSGVLLPALLTWPQSTGPSSALPLLGYTASSGLFLLFQRLLLSLSCSLKPLFASYFVALVFVLASGWCVLSHLGHKQAPGTGALESSRSSQAGNDGAGTTPLGSYLPPVAVPPSTGLEHPLRATTSSCCTSSSTLLASHTRLSWFNPMAPPLVSLNPPSALAPPAVTSSSSSSLGYQSLPGCAAGLAPQRPSRFHHHISRPVESIQEGLPSSQSFASEPLLIPKPRRNSGLSLHRSESEKTASAPRLIPSRKGSLPLTGKSGAGASGGPATFNTGSGSFPNRTTPGSSRGSGLASLQGVEESSTTPLAVINIQESRQHGSSNALAMMLAMEEEVEIERPLLQAPHGELEYVDAIFTPHFLYLALFVSVHLLRIHIAIGTTNMQLWYKWSDPVASQLNLVFSACLALCPLGLALALLLWEAARNLVIRPQETPGPQSCTPPSSSSSPFLGWHVGSWPRHLCCGLGVASSVAAAYSVHSSSLPGQKAVFTASSLLMALYRDLTLSLTAASVPYFFGEHNCYRIVTTLCLGVALVGLLQLPITWILEYSNYSSTIVQVLLTLLPLVSYLDYLGSPYIGLKGIIKKDLPPEGV